MAERPDRSPELADAEARLAELDAERARLQARIDALRRPTAAPAAPAISVVVPAASGAVVPTTQAQKVSMVAELFRGRADVYPRRWENARTGRSGYSPTAPTNGSEACARR